MRGGALTELLPAWVRALAPGVLISVAGVIAFAGVLDQFLERDDLYLVDEPVLEFLAEARTPWLTTLLTGVTHAFGPVILPAIISVGCLAWYLRSKDVRGPALLAGAMVLSTAIAALVKIIVERPRPEEALQVVPGFETSFSFPSGHTTGAATLVMVVAYLSWRRRHGKRALAVWAATATVVIVLVGGSRLYLGYHFVTDVMAGACLGLVTLGAVVAVSRWLDMRATAIDERDS